MIYTYTDDLPVIEISLYHAGYEVTIPAVVDTGAMVSVLPYDVGMQLGFLWEEQTIPIALGAHRAHLEVMSPISPLVAQKDRRTVHVRHKDIQITIVIVIAHRGSPSDILCPTEVIPRLQGDVREGSIPVISKQ